MKNFYSMLLFFFSQFTQILSYFYCCSLSLSLSLSRALSFSLSLSLFISLSYSLPPTVILRLSVCPPPPFLLVVQISVSDEEYISKMNLLGVSIHTACSRCGMELPERVSSPWCTRCKRCAGLCSVCRRPVRGLLHWCPVCGHGGHLSCHKLWFSQNTTCPSGCGHDCCSSMNISVAGSGAGAG